MPTGMQMSLAAQCMFCAEFESDDVDLIGGLCRDCCDDHVAYCEYCGDIMSCMDRDTLERYTAIVRAAYRANRHVGDPVFWRSHRPVDPQDSDEYVCANCAYSCESCGEHYIDELRRDECCELSYGNSSVLNYSFRPPFWFFKMEGGALASYSSRNARSMTDLFMGFEIEVERASRHADKFMEDAGEKIGDPDFLYLKTDGSLSESGVEIVTMPATLAAFTLRMPWDALQTLHANGARSWAYGNCGMHVHVSRAAFSPSHMYKFLKFHSLNERWLAEYAGRETSSYASWGNGDMENIDKRTGAVVKGHIRGTRYSAINMLNEDTIELRYFKGNILKKGILRNAQLVDGIYEYTKQLTYRDVLAGKLAWHEFVGWCRTSDDHNLVVGHVINL